MSQERRNELETERRFGSPGLDRRVRQLSDIALGLSFCVFRTLLPVQSRAMVAKGSIHLSSTPQYLRHLVADVPPDSAGALLDRRCRTRLLVSLRRRSDPASARNHLFPTDRSDRDSMARMGREVERDWPAQDVSSLPPLPSNSYSPTMEIQRRHREASSARLSRIKGGRARSRRPARRHQPRDSPNSDPTHPAASFLALLEVPQADSRAPCGQCESTDLVVGTDEGASDRRPGHPRDREPGVVRHLHLRYAPTIRLEGCVRTDPTF